MKPKHNPKRQVMFVFLSFGIVEMFIYNNVIAATQTLLAGCHGYVVLVISVPFCITTLTLCCSHVHDKYKIWVGALLAILGIISLGFVQNVNLCTVAVGLVGAALGLLDNAAACLSVRFPDVAIQGYCIGGGVGKMFALLSDRVFRNNSFSCLEIQTIIKALLVCLYPLSYRFVLHGSPLSTEMEKAEKHEVQQLHTHGRQDQEQDMDSSLDVNVECLKETTCCSFLTKSFNSTLVLSSSPPSSSSSSSLPTLSPSSSKLSSPLSFMPSQVELSQSPPISPPSSSSQLQSSQTPSSLLRPPSPTLPTLSTSLSKLSSPLLFMPQVDLSQSPPISPPSSPSQLQSSQTTSSLLRPPSPTLPTLSPPSSLLRPPPSSPTLPCLIKLYLLELSFIPNYSVLLSYVLQTCFLFYVVSSTAVNQFNDFHHYIIAVVIGELIGRSYQPFIRQISPVLLNTDYIGWFVLSVSLVGLSLLNFIVWNRIELDSYMCLIATFVLGVTYGISYANALGTRSIAQSHTAFKRSVIGCIFAAGCVFSACIHLFQKTLTSDNGKWSI